MMVGKATGLECVSINYSKGFNGDNLATVGISPKKEVNAPALTSNIN